MHKTGVTKPQLGGHICSLTDKVKLSEMLAELLHENEFKAAPSARPETMQVSSLRFL